VRWVVALAIGFTLAGCGGDQPEPISKDAFPYDPVCDVGPITVEDVTYQVVDIEVTGSPSPAPEPTLGPYDIDGVLERFDDGTATWTGNGYVVSFDSTTDDGMYQVC